MTPEQCTDAVCEHLAGRVVSAMEPTIAGVTEDVKSRIAVPVGYDGAKVIRSKPGQPPRTEFGDYMRSWTYRVAREGDRITGTSGSTLPGRGVWLQKGTNRIAPRPHVDGAADRARAEAPQQLKQNL